jgi:FKBP-type peptidyl-prolyl cis-trans isomerase (trigger factor)
MFGKITRSPKQTDGALITDIAPCQKSLKLRVGLDVIAPVRSTVLAEFTKDAMLPGFRRGRAPGGLVERQFAKAIQDETINRVTKQAFEQAAKAHDLKPVGPFEVSVAEFNATDGLTLEAAVEVEPTFALQSYKGIALKEESAEISPAELEQALTKLQESMAQLVPVGEGESKERQLPAINDELAKDLGYENLQRLREHVEAKLREQKRSAATQALESSLCEELLRRHVFEVPSRLVRHQAERLKRDFKVRSLLSGIEESRLEEHLGKFTEQLRTSAERNVKLAFILDRIAAQESVAVTQDEVVARLWQLSQRWKKDPSEVRKHFDSQGLWPSVLSTIRQEKTIALLLSAAEIDRLATTTTGGKSERNRHTAEETHE